MIPYAPPDLKPNRPSRTKVYILFISGGSFLRMIPLYASVSQNTHSLYFSKNHANLSSIKIRVSRLAAMAADCKSAGLSYVGSSPTWPTKRNRAASPEAAQHKYHTTPVFSCPFSVSPTFCVHSYGTSHLAFFPIRLYDEDTKKE